MEVDDFAQSTFAVVYNGDSGTTVYRPKVNQDGKISAMTKSDLGLLTDTDGDGEPDGDDDYVTYSPGDVLFTFTLDGTYDATLGAYVYHSGTLALFMGDYKIVETSAAERYSLGDDISFTITKDDNKTEKVLDADWTTTDVIDPMTNKMSRGGFSITKVSEPTGEGTPEGNTSLAATFAVINNNDYTVYSADGETSYNKGDTVMTFTTDSETGYYESALDALNTGSYIIKETNSSSGYFLNGGTMEITIVADTITPAGSTFSEPLKRTVGFTFQKADADANRTEQEGDASLAAHFQVINRSSHYVTVKHADGSFELDENGEVKDFEPNSVIWEFDTDELGYYDGSDVLLPVGDHDINEVSTNNTYFLSEDPNGPTTTFTITEDDGNDGNVVPTSGSLTDDVKDIKQQVKRYGFDFQKYETETMKKSSLGKGDLKDVLPDGKTLNTLAAEAPGIKDAG